MWLDVGLHKVFEQTVTIEARIQVGDSIQGGREFQSVLMQRFFKLYIIFSDYSATNLQTIYREQSSDLQNVTKFRGIVLTSQKSQSLKTLIDLLHVTSKSGMCLLGWKNFHS